MDAHFQLGRLAAEPSTGSKKENVVNAAGLYAETKSTCFVVLWQLSGATEWFGVGSGLRLHGNCEHKGSRLLKPVACTDHQAYESRPEDGK
jgi:hypothetical protein